MDTRAQDLRRAWRPPSSRCSQLSSTSSSILVAQVRDQRVPNRDALRRLHAEGRRHGLGHRVARAHSGELAHPHAVGVNAERRAADLEREPCLADAANARDRDDLYAFECVGHARQLEFAPYERRDLRGEVAREGIRRRERREVADEVGVGQLEHHFGPFEVAQAVRPELDHPERSGQRVPHQIRGCLRTENLFGCAADMRRAARFRTVP